MAGKGGWTGRAAILGVLAFLTACAHPGARPGADAMGTDPVGTLQIIAFNDFHGHIADGDQTVAPPGAPRGTAHVAAGGAVHFAAGIARLRAENPASAVVSAGDIIGASPLISGQFLDEPTIRVMNDIGIDFDALGNHEFDRGQDEIRRMQLGGCEKYTLRAPCQVIPDFPGASFRFLAANSLRADGSTLFPAFGIKELHVGGRTVRIGFVGLVLKGVADIVSPRGVAGLHFTDEAETANALIPALRAQGADILVVLIHQGGSMPGNGTPGSCADLAGDLNPVLAKLDPAFDLVISGHTHQSYICDYAPVDPTRPFLVTSAGQYGTLLTRITLRYDFATHRLVSKSAQNLLVAQDPANAGKEGAIADLVDRYRAAAESVDQAAVGRIGGALTKETNAAGESTLGNVIADAQLAAMAAPERGGAQIAFMNRGGLRAAVTPDADGTVRFGMLYGAQPFGNILWVKAVTGAQIKSVLEQQFERTDGLMLVSVSQGFHYAYDLSRPAGQRVFDMTLDGRPIDPAATYHVAMSNFLGQGGDGYTVFASAPLVAEGDSDLDALQAYIVAHPGLAPPALDRTRNATPE